MKRLTIALSLLVFSQVSAALSCEEAWAEYNEFKFRNRMEPSQYPLTMQGAAVRAACGKEALPAPPEADIPPKVIVRKPKPPVPPPPPPPPKPQAPQPGQAPRP